MIGISDFNANIADLMFSLLIATPLTISVWRGIWSSIDFYIFTQLIVEESSCSADGNINCRASENPLIKKQTISLKYESPLNCFISLFVLGLVLRIILQWCQIKWEKSLNILSSIHGRLQNCLTWILSYLYIAVNTCITACMWYGLWNMMNHEMFFYQNRDNATISSMSMVYLIMLLLSIAALIGMKTIGDMISCPLVLQFDSYIEIFGTNYCNDVNLSVQTGTLPFLQKIVKYIATICFTITGWWSIWSMFNYIGNHHLLNIDTNPNKPAKQHVLWDSMILGYAICAVVYALYYRHQRYAVDVNETSLVYRIYIKILAIFGVIGCILSWRGLWSFFDVFTESLIPSEPENQIVSTIISAIILILFGCFNTSTSRGLRCFEQQPSTDNPMLSVKIRNPWLIYLGNMKENQENVQIHRKSTTKSENRVDMYLINDNAILLNEK